MNIYDRPCEWGAACANASTSTPACNQATLVTIAGSSEAMADVHCAGATSSCKFRTALVQSSLLGDQPQSCLLVPRPFDRAGLPPVITVPKMKPVVNCAPPAPVLPIEPASRPSSSECRRARADVYCPPPQLQPIYNQPAPHQPSSFAYPNEKSYSSSFAKRLPDLKNNLPNCAMSHSYEFNQESEPFCRPTQPVKTVNGGNGHQNLNSHRTVSRQQQQTTVPREPVHRLNGNSTAQQHLVQHIRSKQAGLAQYQPPVMNAIPTQPNLSTRPKSPKPKRKYTKRKVAPSESYAQPTAKIPYSCKDFAAPAPKTTTTNSFPLTWKSSSVERKVDPPLFCGNSCSLAGLAELPDCRRKSPALPVVRQSAGTANEQQDLLQTAVSMCALFESYDANRTPSVQPTHPTLHENANTNCDCTAKAPVNEPSSHSLWVGRGADSVYRTTSPNQTIPNISTVTTACELGRKPTDFVSHSHIAHQSHSMQSFQKNNAFEHESNISKQRDVRLLTDCSKKLSNKVVSSSVNPSQPAQQSALIAVSENKNKHKRLIIINNAQQKCQFNDEANTKRSEGLDSRNVKLKNVEAELTQESERSLNKRPIIINNAEEKCQFENEASTVKPKWADSTSVQPKNVQVHLTQKSEHILIKRPVLINNAQEKCQSKNEVATVKQKMPDSTDVLSTSQTEFTDKTKKDHCSSSENIENSNEVILIEESPDPSSTDSSCARTEQPQQHYGETCTSNTNEKPDIVVILADENTEDSARVISEKQTDQDALEAVVSDDLKSVCETDAEEQKKLNYYLFLERFCTPISETNSPVAQLETEDDDDDEPIPRIVIDENYEPSLQDETSECQKLSHYTPSPDTVTMLLPFKFRKPCYNPVVFRMNKIFAKKCCKTVSKSITVKFSVKKSLLQPVIVRSKTGKKKSKRKRTTE